MEPQCPWFVSEQRHFLHVVPHFCFLTFPVISLLLLSNKGIQCPKNIILNGMINKLKMWKETRKTPNCGTILSLYFLSCQCNLIFYFFSLY